MGRDRWALVELLCKVLCKDPPFLPPPRPVSTLPAAGLCSLSSPLLQV